MVSVSSVGGGSRKRGSLGDLLCAAGEERAGGGKRSLEESWMRGGGVVGVVDEE